MRKISSKFWRGYFQTYDILNRISPYQDLIDTFIENLNQNGRTVLDLGSGTGNFSTKLSQNSRFHVVSIDSSPEGIALHKLKNPAADTLLHDIRERLPFHENLFDNIISNNTLYLIDPSERLKVVSEVFRVLKPGGAFISSNILTSFDPKKIYLEHIYRSTKLNGWTRTLFEMLKYIVPTLKIFYYNSIIKNSRENYFKRGEQADLLKKAGFFIIRSESVYAGQAEMVLAKKYK